MAEGPLLACTTHSFGVVPLPAALQIIRALDFACADLIAATFPAQLDPYALATQPDREAERIGTLAAAVGLRLTGCFVGFRERLASPQAEDQARLADLLAGVAAFCQRLGIPHLQMSVGRPELALAPEEQFGVVVENVQRAQRIARAAGVELLIEAQRGAAIATPVDLRRLLPAVPGLRINHDPGQFACQGFGPESYEDLDAVTAHIHLRQARPGALQTRLEEGTVDCRRVVQRLQAAGFQGVYATEYVHFPQVPDCATVDVVTETVKMRDLIRAALADVAR